MLGNLIDNAVKYSPTGEPVEVRVSQSNGSVLVSVCDHGPGIKPDDQRLIFEKFGRVAGGNSKPGTGLGLFIARSIAEAHGGTLEVSSAPGHGATFTLEAGLASSVLGRAELGGRARGRAQRDLGAQLRRLEHDRLAAVGDDLADEPVGAADRLVGERGAVDERAGALLDLPARDGRRVPDARGRRVWSSDGSKPSRGSKLLRSTFALRMRSRR